MAEAVDLVIKFGGVASGEHGDGQARGQFLPQMFGQELFEAFKEFKRIWDPENRMNPGKTVNPDGPPTASRRICGSARTTIRRSRKPTFPSPTTATASPAPRCAAWASAPAGATRAERCALRTWQRERRRIRPAAARGCSSRCSTARCSKADGRTTTSRIRLICAFPARAARATVRSTWTWRPTRPSSWLTIMPAACGPATLMHSAGYTFGRGSPRLRRRWRICLPNCRG